MGGIMEVFRGYGYRREIYQGIKKHICMEFTGRAFCIACLMDDIIFWRANWYEVALSRGVKPWIKAACYVYTI